MKFVTIVVLPTAIMARREEMVVVKGREGRCGDSSLSFPMSSENKYNKSNLLMDGMN